MSAALIYTIIVVLLFAVGFVLRYAATFHADSKLSLLMLAVEKQLSTWAKDQASSGLDKRNAAIKLIADRVYPSLPIWAKMFISEDQLVIRINSLYGEMLDYLDDGKMNNTIK
jgi:uncharacterized ion transporter superfamily protein YfcC